MRTYAVGEECQRPCSGYRRIVLAQRPGGTIAWIGQRAFACRERALVERGESDTWHVDFAAHLKQRRGSIPQAQRHGPHGAQVGGDILSCGAVATGRALDEDAVLVAQADCQAVELGLDREPGSSLSGFV